eukprot:1406919-Pleurochrysis_carterae.AAC.1
MIKGDSEAISILLKKFLPMQQKRIIPPQTARPPEASKMKERKGNGAGLVAEWTGAVWREISSF